MPMVRGVAFTDDSEAEAYLLADNQTTILGGWDDGELQKIIESLGTENLLAGTGFEEIFQDQFGVTQDDPTTLIDQAAELRRKWETARGQLWQIGEHRPSGTATPTNRGRPGRGWSAPAGRFGTSVRISVGISLDRSFCQRNGTS